MSGSPDAARGPLHPEPAGTDTNARPAVGDRVRVVIEGEVIDVSGSGRVLHLGDHECRYTTPSELATIPGGSVSVEVLPPPEPAHWPPQMGDAWQLSGTTHFVHGDGYGNRYVTSTGGGGFPKSLTAWTEWALDWRTKHASLGFTLLLRHGKPVK